MVAGTTKTNASPEPITGDPYYGNLASKFISKDFELGT